MNLEDLLSNYPHSEFVSSSVDKMTIPMTKFYGEEFAQWNEIYNFVKSNFHECEPTPSGAMPSGRFKYLQRYIIVKTPGSFELCLMTFAGCFRFVFAQQFARFRMYSDNPVSGAQALKILYKHAKDFGCLEVFQREAVGTEEGKTIKAMIESPMIRLYDESLGGLDLENCHHIDMNSSYASQIVEAFPELLPLYTDLYNRRKDHDGYFKHVLTNSIGAMQSRYCISPFNCFTPSPYSLSKFAKIAINGNNDKLRSIVMTLISNGRKPVLLNTDGVWYQGEIFHQGGREGTKLGQWKNDHQNCVLYVKSPGAYQYIENGEVHSVVRGFTGLDVLKPDRRSWRWHDIDSYPAVKMFKFDKEKGISEEWVNV